MEHYKARSSQVLTSENFLFDCLFPIWGIPGKVSEEVRGVCGDGQAVGEDAAHYLGRHEDEAEHRGEDELVPGPGNVKMLNSSGSQSWSQPHNWPVRIMFYVSVITC